MAYSKTINITPATITNLTIIIKDVQPSFYDVLTLDDFTLGGDTLSGSIKASSNDTEISIYSQGFTPVITTYGNLATNITLVATSDYTKTSDGTNNYYVKDSYSRNFENDLLNVVMTKADNSAVQSELDGKVSKSGDTMSGELDFVFPELDLTTTPSADTYKGITLKDANGNRIGRIEVSQHTDGSYGTILSTKKYGGNEEYNFIRLGYDNNNQPTVNAPNLNGAFHYSSYNLAEGVSVNGSTDVNYSLANYLPNDNYNYYVWVFVYALGDAIAGHTNNVSLSSSIFSSSSVCRSINRTAASTLSSGTTVIPIGTDRILNLNRSTNWYGTATLYLRGYQRIGINS